MVSSLPKRSPGVPLLILHLLRYWESEGLHTDVKHGGDLPIDAVVAEAESADRECGAPGCAPRIVGYSLPEAQVSSSVPQFGDLILVSSFEKLVVDDDEGMGCDVRRERGEGSKARHGV